MPFPKKTTKNETDPRKAAHDENYPFHSGVNGHHCPNFDDMWVCNTCAEMEGCTCFNEEGFYE